MGFRLSAIVTRTGDDGTTGLGDGARVAKDHPRVCVLGDLDELNSAIGCVLAEDVPGSVREALAQVQDDLFDLGGELCVPGRATMSAAHASRLDARVTELNAHLAPLREFVLPGGTRAAAACHLARAVCRRAERGLALLGRSEAVSAASRQYLNRLSDLLFVCARTINRAADRNEAQWRNAADPGGGA